MNHRRLFVAAFLLAAFLASIVVQPTQAQNACPYGYIEDETGTLDTAGVCQALAQWSNKGIIVLVFYSGDDFGSEDDWYARLDTFEANIECRTGQACRSGNDVDVDLLALEGNHSGELVDITTGNTLYVKGFDNVKSQIKNIMTSGIKAGDPTNGYINALNEAYTAMYPPQAQAQPPVVVIMPTAELKPTPIPIDWTPVKKGVSFAFWLLVIAVAGAGAVVFYVRVIEPQRKLLRQKARVEDILTRWLLVVGGFFGNTDTAETSDLYTLFKVYGVQAYPKIDKKVLEWIGTCLAALAMARRNFNDLRTRGTAEVRQMTLSQLVAELKAVYFTLVGTRRDVLAMDDGALKALLQPMMETTPKEGAGVNELLVRRMREQSDRLRTGPLKLEVQVAEASAMDAQGILGYIRELKEQLEELRTAAGSAGPKLDKAKREREAASGHPFPRGVTPSQALNAIDALIASAENDMAERQYLLVVRKAEDVLSLIAALREALGAVVNAERALAEAQKAYTATGGVPSAEEVFTAPSSWLVEAKSAILSANYAFANQRAVAITEGIVAIAGLIGVFAAALSGHESRMNKVEAARSAGFRLDFLLKGLAEVGKDSVSFKAAIMAGKWEQAKDLVAEITADSTEILTQTEAIQAVRATNAARLTDLSKAVARVQSVADGEAALAWEGLKSYPRPNWLDVASNLADARTALGRLFDNPADEKDLASQVLNLNSMGAQQFRQAEKELTVAFAVLTHAENQLRAIITRLTEIQSAEANVGKTQEAISEALATAKAFLSKEDRLIDATVDRDLDEADVLLLQVITQINRREFLAAQRTLDEANKLVRTAASSANEQARRLNVLLKDVVAVKDIVVRQVATARREQNALPAAARTSEAESFVRDAENALQEAQRAEVNLGRLEDRALAEALDRALNAYRQAKESANRALAQITEDKRRYDRIYNEVQACVSEAAKMVSSAGSRITHSDVSYAARSAYDRARQLMPTMPAYGATIAEFERTRGAALKAKSEADDALTRANRDIRMADDSRNTYVGTGWSTGNTDFGSPTSTFAPTSYISQSHRVTSPPRSESHRSTPMTGPSHRSSSNMGGSHRR